MEQLCLWLYILFSLLQYPTAFSFINNNNNNNTIMNQYLCRQDESQLLLQLKQQLSPDYLPYPEYYYKTKYWKGSRDCCKWDGVTCDDFTGHVISLDLGSSFLMGELKSNSSLFHLTHLRKLDLSDNNIVGSAIPSEFGRLNALTHLNLSNTFFEGEIPMEFYHLSNLLSLDISSANPPFHAWLVPKIRCDLKMLFGNMTRLRVLQLPFQNLNNSEMPMNMSSFLTHLDLEDTRIQGNLPPTLFEKPNLQVLRLGGNRGLKGLLTKSLNWSSIKMLDLSRTSITGRLPDSVGFMTNLNYMYLSWTSISGALPDSIGLMTNLNYMDLSYCRLSGPIPESIGNITAVTSMHLSFNEFSGRLPSTIFNLRYITTLDVSHNHLEGQLPDAFFGLQNLDHMDLSYNNFEGRIPSSLTNMSQLEQLDISSNALTGPFPSRAGHGLQMLSGMDFSNNSIQGTIPAWFFSLPSLNLLDLSSNRLTGKIGKLNSQNFTLLFLSSNRLNIQLESFYNLTKINSLSISYNTVTEHGGDVVNNTLGTLASLEMSYCGIKEFPNFLQSARGLKYLDLSKNNISSSFPSSICNMNSLTHLDLSDNKLSGNIPKCLPNLEVLDLRRNELHGKIPAIGSTEFPNLVNLGLNGNHLEGPLPLSLANCTSLEVIDLGNNIIQGTFPWWLHTLPELKILILKSNSFHSSITSPSFTNNSFTYLQILDLSYNNFTGLLPEKIFASLQTIKNSSKASRIGSGLYMGKERYRYSVTLSVKGAYVELTKVLNIFTTIDLSSNNFNGIIPESLSNLTSLRLLNLSHNNLHGSIPPALGRMTNLEQLDLSSNQLVGGIPQTLTSLTFLGDLDLSHNRLVGPIPVGNQFPTFSNESYVGNSGLCGAPLTRSCGDEREPPSKGDFEEEEEEEEEDGFMLGFTWKVVVMGYGCGTVLGFILGYVMIYMEKPRWLARFVYVEAAIILRRRNKRRRMVQGRR